VHEEAALIRFSAPLAASPRPPNEWHPRDDAASQTNFLTGIASCLVLEWPSGELTGSLFVVGVGFSVDKGLDVEVHLLAGLSAGALFLSVTRETVLHAGWTTEVGMGVVVFLGELATFGGA